MTLQVFKLTRIETTETTFTLRLNLTQNTHKKKKSFAKDKQVWACHLSCWVKGRHGFSPSGLPKRVSMQTGLWLALFSPSHTYRLMLTLLQTRFLYLSRAFHSSVCFFSFNQSFLSLYVFQPPNNDRVQVPVDLADRVAPNHRVLGQRTG